LYFVGALTVVVAAMAVVLIWLVRKQTTSPPLPTAAPSETSQRCVRLNVHAPRPKTCKFPRILQILSSSRCFVAHFAKRECEQHTNDAGGIRSYWKARVMNTSIRKKDDAFCKMQNSLDTMFRFVCDCNYACYSNRPTRGVQRLGSSEHANRTISSCPQRAYAVSYICRTPQYL